MKVPVDLKHTNKILIIKMEQIKHKKRKANLQNQNLKDNLKIIVIILA